MIVDNEIDFLVGAALKAHELTEPVRSQALAEIQRRKQLLKTKLASELRRQFDAGIELGRRG